MKTITLQIQIEVTEERVTPAALREVRRQLDNFRTSFSSLGYTRDEMFIDEEVYIG